MFSFNDLCCSLNFFFDNSNSIMSTISMSTLGIPPPTCFGLSLGDESSVCTRSHHAPPSSVSFSTSSQAPFSAFQSTYGVIPSQPHISSTFGASTHCSLPPQLSVGQPQPTLPPMIFPTVGAPTTTFYQPAHGPFPSPLQQPVYPPPGHEILLHNPQHFTVSRPPPPPPPPPTPPSYHYHSLAAPRNMENLHSSCYHYHSMAAPYMENLHSSCYYYHSLAAPNVENLLSSCHFYHSRLLPFTYTVHHVGEAQEVIESNCHRKSLLGLDCGAACVARCRLCSRPNLCHRACGTCCVRCGCLLGTSSSQELCLCHYNKTTHGGSRKCP